MANGQTAPAVRVSNHSYGDNPGWAFVSDSSIWNWTDPSLFGDYDVRSYALDQTAAMAPYNCIVLAAGNDRGNGTTAAHWHDGEPILQNDSHPFDCATGYGCMPPDSGAKNIFTVGSTLPPSVRPTDPSHIVISEFSSRGPTDDGRIKPDFVAMGDSVISSTNMPGDTSYYILSGTSFAAPAVSGSIALLHELWKERRGQNQMLLSATMKALLVHTAREAGSNPGPDYIYGWGLVDFKAAADLMVDDEWIPTSIIEDSLMQGQVRRYVVYKPDDGVLRATIAWTDPAKSGNVSIALVNDLDLKITDCTNDFLPWALDGANPANAATKGNNNVDNVEQVVVEAPTGVGFFVVEVSHKGVLKDGRQDFGLIISGQGPPDESPVVIQNVNYNGVEHFIIAQSELIMENVEIETNPSGIPTSLFVTAGKRIDFRPGLTMYPGSGLNARIFKGCP